MNLKVRCLNIKLVDQSKCIAKNIILNYYNYYNNNVKDLNMKLKKINDSNYEHLYYLITRGIDNKELYSGLAHVGEHVCLIPYYSSSKLHSDSHFAFGYTCINHACLYYCCSMGEEWLDEIENLILSCNIVNEKNVRYAKNQVIEECINLREITKEREEIVRFVTDNEIQNFAMGNINEIKEIQCQDILNWLESIKKNIIKIKFASINELQSALKENMSYSSTILKKHKYILEVKKHDEYFYINPTDKKMGVDIFLKLPIFYKKENFIMKAFLEYIFQIICKEKLGIDIIISEKNFNFSQRFLSITIHGLSAVKIKKTIIELKTIFKETDTGEFTKLKSNFKTMMKKVLFEEKKNSDYINEFQNYILYGKPIFGKEDIELLNYIDNKKIDLDLLTSWPLKIVVRDPNRII